MSKERNWKWDVLNWEMGICNGKRYMTINIEILSLCLRHVSPTVTLFAYLTLSADIYIYIYIYIYSGPIM